MGQTGAVDLQFGLLAIDPRRGDDRWPVDENLEALPGPGADDHPCLHGERDRRQRRADAMGELSALAGVGASRKLLPNHGQTFAGRLEQLEESIGVVPPRR